MADNGDARIAVTCLRCGEALDGFTSVGEGDMPGPGAVSICLYCGDLALFTTEGDGIALRPPTAVERFELLEDDDVVAAMTAVLAARQALTERSSTARETGTGTLPEKEGAPMAEDVGTTFTLNDGWAVTVAQAGEYVEVDWANRGAQAPQPWVFTPEEAIEFAERLRACAAAITLNLTGLPYEVDGDTPQDSRMIHSVTASDFVDTLLALGPHSPVMVCNREGLTPLPFAVGVGVALADNGDLTHALLIAVDVTPVDAPPGT